MIDVDSEPRSGEIRVSKGNGTTTFSWPNPRGGFRRYVIVAACMMWICGFARGAYEYIASLLSVNTPMQHPPLPWVIGCIIVLPFPVSVVIGLLRSPTSSVLEIDGDRLRFRAGHNSEEVLRIMNLQGQMVWEERDFAQPKTPIVLRRRDVKHVRLYELHGRQRLAIDCGRKKLIEVGAGLTDEEQEWLGARLLEWRNEA